MLEHIDKEAHRGVFVYVGERIRLVVTYLLLLTVLPTVTVTVLPTLCGHEVTGVHHCDGGGLRDRRRS